MQWYASVGRKRGWDPVQSRTRALQLYEQVVATEISPYRIDLARKVGVDAVLNPKETDGLLAGIGNAVSTSLEDQRERIFLPFLKLTLPEIVDYNLPEFGVFHNCAFVKIKKEYPFQARRVMHAVWGAGQMAFTKFIVVVDEHVNVHDEQDVLFHLFSNCDPHRDTEIVHGPVDILDHASPDLGAGSKMGFDATAKLPAEGLLLDSEEGQARMAELFPKYKEECEAEGDKGECPHGVHHSGFHARSVTEARRGVLTKP